MSRPYPVSFSKLNCYEQCGQKFYHTYIEPLPRTETEQMIYGTLVHNSLEKYGRSGDYADLIPAARPFKWIVDKVLSLEGDKYFEHQMAISADRAPCAWDAEELYLRGIADVLVINKGVAYCLDYKTGKPKADGTQLMIFALLVFQHFPGVRIVKSSFLWLAYNDITHTEYLLRYAEPLWDGLTRRIGDLQMAVANNLYTTNPSRLCGWCAAKEICPDAYDPKRSRR